jgi:NADPH-dependent 2,4-dienoyl-CoA reductase/sulfur reductase-like enzyme
MTATEQLRIVIVGGVAGGMSAATRLRRLGEHAKITVFESGQYVSYANCGIPYALGRVIEDEESLILQTPKSFKDRFNIDVHQNATVTAIHRPNKEITVRHGNDRSDTYYQYDYLILAQGAEAARLPIPGTDLPQVFSLQTIDDLEAIKSFILVNECERAVVVGGGFIGLEAAENLRRVREFLSPPYQHWKG